METEISIQHNNSLEAQSPLIKNFVQSIVSSSMVSEDVLSVGKNYFKNIRMVDGMYRTSKKIKGYHKESVVKNEIKRKKIEQVLEYCKAKGAEKITHSMMTSSVYFFINEIEYRISDHSKSNFLGVDITVAWNSNMDELLNKVGCNIAANVLQLPEGRDFNHKINLER